MDINLISIIKYYFGDKWSAEKVENNKSPQTVLAIKGRGKTDAEGIVVNVELHNYDEGDAVVYFGTRCGYPESREEMDNCNEEGITYLCKELGRCDLLAWETELVKRHWRYKSTSKILASLNNENQDELPLYVDIDGDKGRVWYLGGHEHILRKKNNKWGVLVVVDGIAEVA